LMNEHEEVLQSDSELKRLTTSEDINLDTQFVSKEKFGNVVRASFPQDASPARLSFEEVVNRIFSGQTVKSFPQLMEICENDIAIADMCKAIL